MASFTDRRGREWSLDLDVWLVEKIHKRTAIRLDKLVDNKLADLPELLGDLVRFGQFLWVLCEEQATERGLTPEELARGFNGLALERAADALIQSIADFIPRHQSRVLNALVARTEQLQADMTTEAEAAIAAWSPTPSTPATTAPPSSASTPPAAA